MDLTDILGVKTRIYGNEPNCVKKTPIWRLDRLSSQLGCNIFVKAEHLQYSGSFKIRGVLNWFLAQTPDKGFAAIGGDDLTLALCWVCHVHSIPFYVFLDENTQPVIQHRLEGWGARVTISEKPEKEIARLAQEQSLVLLDSTAKDVFLGGYGTVALEILEQKEWFDAFLVPYVSGQLYESSHLVLNALRPSIPVFACSHSQAKIQVENRLEADPESLKKAQYYLAFEEKQLIEKKGTLGLGALIANASEFEGKDVLTILTGGNGEFPQVLGAFS